MSLAEKQTRKAVFPRNNQVQIQEVAKIEGWDEARLKRIRSQAKEIIQKMRVNQPFSPEIGKVIDEMGVTIAQLEKYSLIYDTTWTNWVNRDYEVVDRRPITPGNIAKFASFFGFSVRL